MVQNLFAGVSSEWGDGSSTGRFTEDYIYNTVWFSIDCIALTMSPLNESV